MGSMTAFVFLVTTLLISDVTGIFDSGRCPAKSKVYNKDPVCHSDADCQRWGKVCCPNQFNTKSCSYPAPYGQRDGNYKYYSGYVGKNCANDKYRPYENGKYRPYDVKLLDKLLTRTDQRISGYDLVFPDKNVLMQ